MQAIPAPAIPDVRFLSISDKADCRIAYTFRTLLKSETQDIVWIVFVNGLGLPQAFWQPSIQLLEDHLSSHGSNADFPKVIATTYDRYAQGLSKIENNAPPQKHDLADAANELHNVITHLHHLHKTELSNARIILVAHSIGVPQARLYLDKKTAFRDSIAGAVFLDSNVANIDLVSVFPDPESPSFDASKLPPDTTVEQLSATRAFYAKMFAPSAPNAENLDRSTLPGLLPFADQPTLRTASQPEFPLTVVAHDAEAFVAESLRISTRGLTEQYVEPAWHNYNLGLLELSGRDNVSAHEIVVASGAAHFVQKDNPQCIAAEIYKLATKIVNNS